ncbi:Ig-like domain-containing protein [Aminipila sp.]|uniref:Ig-like domain-containing protein n=1 Tax=Aminipila sp. TaxID=2060095 RepID=UPI00289C70CC|nr:Ig-like domain-containing protein [Aminipila sp.]
MKRFIAIFTMLCLMLGLSSVSAWAATVGNQLSRPETGWARFEDNNVNIIYKGNWETNVYHSYSGQNAHLTNENKAQVAFKFRGTKFRIISQTTNAYSNNIQVNIDGNIDASFSEYNASITGEGGCSTLVYEKTGLQNVEHIITLTNLSNKYFQLDAVDIDENGKLLLYDSTAKLSVLLNQGENVQLSTSYDLDNNKKYTWSSTNEAVATVDANGKVTALADGTADVYAQNADGTFKEYIPVKVVEGIADELRLAVHLKAGEKAKLYLTDDPGQVTWSSMDDSTVTVSADGQVTGVKKGLAIVKAELDRQTYQIYVRVNG